MEFSRKANVIEGGDLTYSKLHIRRSIALHSFFGMHSILTGKHLDEGMALVDIDNACLH